MQGLDSGADLEKHRHIPPEGLSSGHFQHIQTHMETHTHMYYSCEDTHIFLHLDTLTHEETESEKDHLLSKLVSMQFGCKPAFI